MQRVPVWRLLAAAAPLALAACTAVHTDSPRVDEAPGFDVTLYDAADRDPLDLSVGEVEPVGAGESAAIRIRFSFVAYRGYPDSADVRRATGTLFLPVGKDGQPRAGRSGEILLVEYPPGSSRTGFDVLGELGQGPAVALDMAAAVVDIRGPVLRDLGSFRNQDASDGAGFTGEDQFGYAMLRSYAATGDLTLLWEQRVAEAWLRAIRAADRIVSERLGTRRNRFVLAGERWGALGAVQAAAVDAGVAAVVACGWPMDGTDQHFVRWRRWERDANHDPLERIRPTAWRDSRDLLSFLTSSWGNPDPGCPSCVGSGARWRAQFDPLALKRGPLERVPLWLVLGDSDPDLPLDLLARSSAPPERLAALPPPAGAPSTVPRGPFAEPREYPFDDLLYLRDSPPTLAHPEVAASVTAWLQRLAGHRDLPRPRVLEEIADGQLEVTVVAGEGNATVTGVEVFVMDIGPLDGSDFMHALHRPRPENPAWRSVEPLYAGHDRATSGRFSTARWKARFPFEPDRNQAYYVVVRTRVGAVTAAHSLPARVLWSLGDPASGPARL